MVEVMFVCSLIVDSLIVTIGILVAVAYLTVVERKYLSSIQRRRGPNVVGVYGLLQAFADGLKLLLKETTKPRGASSVLFFSAPCLSFTISLVCWSMIPFSEGLVLVPFEFGLLFIVSISSLGVYGVLLGGWSSHSVFSLLGALRSCSQMLSYELPLAMCVLTVVLYSGGTMDLTEIVLSQECVPHCVGLSGVCALYFISVTAETNRHPFDLPEAESELVSGYNVEYSSGGFILFFLGEYCNMVLTGSLVVLLFFGGWYIGGVGSCVMFSCKVSVVLCMYVFLRACYPRYRVDQLIVLSWRELYPLSLAWFSLVVSTVFVFG